MGLMQSLFRFRATRRREPRSAVPPARRSSAWPSRRRSASRLGRFEQLEGRALLAGLTGFEFDTFSSATIEATNAEATAFTGTYTFGADGNVTSFAYNGTAIGNLTVSPLTKNGITTSSSNNNFRGSDWPIGATNGSDVFTIGDVNPSKYIEFTLTAADGFVIDFPTITFGIGRSGTGPRQWQWRSSVDGFTTPITVTTVNAGLVHSNGVVTNPDTTATTWTNNVIATSGNQSFSDLGSVTFRLYGYNAESTGGTGGLQGPLTFGGSLKEGAAVTPPVILASGSVAPFATVAGSASDSRSFSVEGSNLTEAILVTAPSNFEVSTDNVTFATTRTLQQTNGSASGTVHVRLAAGAAVGATAGNVTLSSDGAPTVTVPVSGSVRPTVITLPYGPEDFEATSEPWFTFSDAGTADWQFVTTTRGNGQSSEQPVNRVWQANGFPSTNLADDWLLLGPFDMSGLANPTISFASLNAFTSNGTIVDELSLKVSSDFTGNGSPSAATWATLPFAKPAAENTKTSSGQVSLTGMAGQPAVYVAFHYVAAGNEIGTTALWQIDDVAVFDLVTPALNLVAPGIIDEGTEGVAGTVTIPQPIGTPLDVVITSSNADWLLVRAGEAEAAAFVTITIPAGETSAGFLIDAIRDFRFGPDVAVTLSASVADTSHDPASATITVRNIDPEPALLTADGYTQDFSTFVANAALPTGWAIAATGNQLGRSDWDSTTTGVKHSSATVNVFGYQHTGTTGIATQTLTLQNDTGAELTAVTISYVGRTARNEARIPSYTVTVEGQAVAALAYSTAEGDGVTKTVAVTGLSIPAGRVFQIVWTSDRGLTTTGTSRTIGISDVSVSVGATLLAPSIANLAVPALTVARESAEASAEVTSDGGADVTARGFVYIASSDLIEGVTLDLDTPGAITVASDTGVGSFAETLTGLTAATSYTIRAYATNSEGTAYTSPVTFQTVGPAASLTGVYEQPFDNFTGTLPTGWWAVSGGNALGYIGGWGTGTSAGFVGGQTDPGVLGYQHTTATSPLTITLSLINDTGSTISSLDIGYLGRVARVDQGRTPAWEVTVNGDPVAALGYSTGEAADRTVSTTLTGLSIAPDDEITIQWVSTNGDGNGSSRQIGIGEVVVTAGVEATAAPAVALGDPATSLITPSTARLQGSVTAANGLVTSHGVVYALTSENPAPTLRDDGVIIVEISGGGLTAFDFAVDLADLTPGAEYSFRAFAINSFDTGYSDVGTWTTTTQAAVPTVTSPTVTDITASTATVGGTVVSSGGATITEYGVVLSVQSANATPVLGDDGVIVVSVEEAIAGTFTLPATGLSDNTTYAYRAFATNSEGTSYSTVGSFTTPTLPTALAVGDLSIIGFNANAPDGLAFVTWVDLAANTQIKFTDNGFLSTGSANDADNARAGENFVTWTNTSGGTIAAGTVVTIVDAQSTPAGATASVGSTAQVLSGLSANGDQIFAYQGPGAGTTNTNSDFAAATGTTTFTGSLVFGLNFGSDWLASGTATSNLSYLPSELAGGTASIALTATGTSRGQYNGPRFGFETIADAKAAVTDPDNWTTATGTGTFVLDTTPFVIGAVVGTTTTITLDTITPLSSTVGTPITFSGTVAAAAGSTTPAGTIQIRSGGATGPVVASTSTISGTGGTGTYSIEVTTLPVGVYGTLQAFFVATPFFDASESEVFIDPVTVRPVGLSPQFVRWTFEGDSLVPLVGAGTAAVIGGASSAFSTGTGSGRGWNTAAYPAQGTASGTAGVQFMVSTVGRESITLSFDQRASGTASRWAQVDYTLNGGADWVTGFWNNNGGLSPHDTFYSFDVDFSGVSGANNNADFGVRIVSIFAPETTSYQQAGTSTYGTSGTWRFDNVAFGGFAGPTIRTATGTDPLRIATYNIAASQGDGAPRNGLTTILEAIGTEVVAGWSGPLDLLALQEVQSQTATTQIVVDALNGVYGAGTYGRGNVNAFASGGATLGLVYNTNSLTLLEELSIATAGPRDAMRYLFQPVAGTSADIFYVYVSHLKAGTSSADRAMRAQEAATIRADADRLGAGTSILYVGDFNVYTSSEVAYQTLVGGGGGQAIDPIDRPGSWNNNAAFREVFTQAPAVNAPAGLAGGGLDDRFDFQLVTDAVLNGTGLRYVPETYRAFGNNGTVSVGGSINDPSNTALAGLVNRSTVLDLLTTVSDHLPVVADYTVPRAAPLEGVTTTQGSASEAQSFIVQARSLTGNLQVAAPAGFEVSTSADSGYTTAPLTLAETAGSVNATVYIRVAATAAAGVYSGDIEISGGGAVTTTLAMPTSTVSPREISVRNVTVADKVYDGTTVAVVSGELVGVFGSDDVSLAAVGSFASGNVGTGITVTLALVGADAGNYVLTQPGLTADITAATLIVTADDASRDAGEANPTFTATITGFVNDETAETVLTGIPLLTTTADESSPAGTYAIVAAVGTLAANDGNYVFEFVDGTLTINPVGPPAVGPRISGVFARGSAWAAGYLGLDVFTTVAGERLGWQLQDGPGQLANTASVTWENVDRVAVRFDQPITAPAVDAAWLVRGLAPGDRMIQPAGVELLAGGTVAVWSFAEPLASGKYLLSIPAAGITNLDGTATLDGEWTTGVSTFAGGSGDGTAGGDFVFEFNVLVGDVNQSGSVNATDINDTRNARGGGVGAANFRMDINGSGSVNATDVNGARNQRGFGLAEFARPQGPGTGPQGAGSGISAAAWAWYALEQDESKSGLDG